MPKLSIITINYNNCMGLQKTMQSVFEQTYTDYEYIIIDGGSVDGSPEYIKQHTDKLSYWTSEKDKGIYNAMNKGIRQAKGKYCLFLNSGDQLINNNILSEVFADFTNEDIVYGNIEISNKTVVIPDKLTFMYFYINSLAHPAAFIKRDLFNKYGGYNEENKIVSDWEFFIVSLAKYNCSYRKIDMVISHFDTGGISSQVEVRKNITPLERQKVMMKHFSLIYEDYAMFISEKSRLKKELAFYENSKLIQLIKKIQQSSLYKTVRKIDS
jgi:glycosyltransferase involved in cell wall biosynthesis